MSMSSSKIAIESEIEVIFENESIESTDPPRVEWSSLLCLENPYINPKQILQEQGLYDPGSGEICTKYFPQSDSAVFRHPYYSYPAIVDPGIDEALNLPEPKPSFGDDGQELYLFLCKEMGECPIRMFRNQLFDENINLKYYGISQLGFRPLAMSLKLNRYVQVLDLTSNFISMDGCFHLGDMLAVNITLKELILCGCRMGPKGTKNLVVNLHINRALRKLDISKNQMEDEGVEYLAGAIYKGAEVKEINLSYNNLTGKSCVSLAEAMEINNKLTHLDLSWNKLLSPRSLEALCTALSESKFIKVLNFSWDGLNSNVNVSLKLLFNIAVITRLDFSNNNLSGQAINTIVLNLPKANKLEYLNLSSNPISPENAKKILNQMRLRKIKIKTLLLDHVTVNADFLVLWESIMKLPFRKNVTMTYGDVKKPFVPTDIDMRNLVLSSAQKICSKPKKQAVDVGLLILEIHKKFKEPLPSKDFYRACRMQGVTQMNEDLVDEIALAFPGPRLGKIRTINLEDMVDYVKRKWPDTKLPPTPPPEPEPISPKKGKGDKKKKR